MSAQESTWESAIQSADTPPPIGETTDVPDVPVEATPTPAEETTAPAPDTAIVETPSDDAAREATETPTAEQATEETAQTEPTDDPAEVAALPVSARKWARSRDRDAKVVDEYLDTEKPISDVAQRLYEKSQSRYAELASDIYSAHKDEFLKQEFGLSAEEIRARLETPQVAGASPGSTGLDPTNTDPTDIDSPLYDPLQDPNQPESVKAMIREARELKGKHGELESKVSTIEQQEQKRAQEAREAQVEQIGKELYESVMSVVPEGIKEYGLEVSEKDPPIIKGLKLAAQHILKTEVEPTFSADPDNMKAVNRAGEYAKRLERENAFREEDALKVRTRSALSKVKDREEVKAIFDAIKLWSDSKAQQIDARGKGAPQVPSTLAGGTMPVSAPAATWGELVGESR